jgi:hypothetical protein
VSPLCSCVSSEEQAGAACSQKPHVVISESRVFLPLLSMYCHAPSTTSLVC